MPVPDGYILRFPLATAIEREPVKCDGCDNMATVLEGFEKHGEPDIWVCGGCYGDWALRQDVRAWRWITGDDKVQAD